MVAMNNTTEPQDYSTEPQDYYVKDGERPMVVWNEEEEKQFWESQPIKN